MDPSTADTIADPRWFPLRYDVAGDAVLFARIEPEMHRALTFLADFRPPETRSIPRAELAAAQPRQAPFHLILHSGLGGSTLLARALAQSGVVTTLKEPPILTDLVAFALRRPEDESRRLLRDVALLLARPFAAGEALVCKMSSVGNGLCTAIAKMRPDTQILCLQTPLDQFLASLASKGAEGRAAGRRLFVGLQNSGMTCVTIDQAELAAYPDLQLAALAWLSIQKMIGDAGKSLGGTRVRSLDTEMLLSDPARSLAAIASHLGLHLDVDARLASGVFSRHAKTGEPFDAGKRAAALSTALSRHGAEIFPIVDWARKTSEAMGIAWNLPGPLLD